MYLIHWPGASRINVSSTDNIKLRKTTWETLIDLKKENKLKSIGVSNYTIKHLEQLLEYCKDVKPDVNQVYLIAQIINNKIMIIN